MVAPIKNPKVDIETDLEIQSSCNCSFLCCPTFIKRGSSPVKPKTPPAPVARHSWGRAFSLWGSSKNGVPTTPNNSPASKVSESVTRAASPVFEESERK